MTINKITLIIASFALFAFHPIQAQSEEYIKVSGFAQTTLEAGEGTTSNSQEAGIKYGADRVRIGFKAKKDKVFGKFVLDFNKVGSTQQNELPEIIQDLHIDYALCESMSLRFGQFKTPLGMDYHRSGSALDVVKRGADNKLILNRAFGLNVNFQPSDKITFDLGHFMPAKRSTSVSSGTAGKDSSFVARIKTDLGFLKLEGSAGLSQDAGTTGKKNYVVYDIGVMKEVSRFIFKLEWIEGINITGISGFRQKVGFFTTVYDLSKRIDLVFRPYLIFSDRNGTSTQLINYILGLNYDFSLTGKLQSRLQANVLLAQGDTRTYAGLGGYTGHAFLLMWQLQYQ